MKRLIAATLALTMLGSTAAMAHDYRGYGYHGYRHHKHHDNLGPAIAVGLGVAALAIIASSQSDHDRYERRGYYYAPNGYYYRNRADYDRYRGYYRDHDRYRNYDRDRGYYRDYDGD
jgi:hypothetical protein